MSFEGYRRRLCANGHLLSGEDVYEETEKVCPVCGAGFVWGETVDQTNGQGPKTPLKQRRPAVVKRCNLGHDHIIEGAMYEVPK